MIYVLFKEYTLNQNLCYAMCIPEKSLTYSPHPLDILLLGPSELCKIFKGGRSFQTGVFLFSVKICCDFVILLNSSNSMWYISFLWLKVENMELYFWLKNDVWKSIPALFSPFLVLNGSYCHFFFYFFVSFRENTSW